MKKLPDVPRNPIAFFQGIFILFLGLKLAGEIDWSWWAVFSPFAADLILHLIKTIGKMSKEDK